MDDKLKLQVSLEVSSKDKQVVTKEIDKLKKDLEKKLDLKMTTSTQKQLNNEKLILQAKERTAIFSQKQIDVQAKINSSKTKELMLEKQSTDQLKQKIKLFQEQQSRGLAQFDIGKFSKFADKGQLESFKKELNGLSVDTPNVSNKMKDLASQFSTIKTEAQGSRQGIVRFREDMVHSFKAFSEFFLIGGIVVGTINAVKSAIDSVIKLDTAMTNLGKVSGATSAQLDMFKKDVFETAKEMGVLAEDVVDASSVFARAGYNLGESKELGKSAILLSNVADSFQDVNTSGEQIISIMKGFGLEASEASGIVDKLNEVSNKFNVSNTDLSEGLKRTAATMSIFGNDIDETIGLLSGSTEVLGNWEKSSRGIMTISRRLQGLTEDGKKSGEMIAKNEKLANEFGITLLDQQGNFRKTFDIINDIAVASEGLGKQDPKKFQYFLQQVAGGDQLPVLASLIKNIDGVNKALDASRNSYGSAQVEQERYLESIEGRMKTTSASIEEFYSTLVNTDAVKNVVTGFGEIIEGMTYLTNSFGAFPVVLGVATVALAVFNKELLITIGSGIGNLLVEIPKVIAYFQQAGVATGVATLGLQGLVSGIATALPVIGLLGTIWYNNTKVMRDADAVLKDVRKNTLDNASSAETLLQSLSGLAEKTTLTKAEQEKLQGTYEQLLIIYPDLKKKIGDNVGSYNALTTAVLASADAQRQLALDSINAQQALLHQQAEAKRQLKLDRSRDSGWQTGFSPADTLPTLDAEIKQLGGKYAELQKLKDSIKNAKIDPIGSTGGSKGNNGEYGGNNGGNTTNTGSSTKSNDYLSTLSTRYQDLEKAVTLTNESLRINQGLQNFVEGENKIKLLQEEIKLQEKLKVNLQDLNKERRKERSELLAKINKMGIKTKTENDITTILNPQAIKSLSNDQQEMFDKLFGNVKDLNSNIKSTGETWFSANDKIKSSYKAIQDEMDSIKDKKLKELNEALEAQKKQLKKQFDEEYDKLSKLSDLQEIADEKAIDAKQSEIEAIKKKNDEIDKTNERLEKELELQKALDERANILSQRNVRFLGANGFEFIADPIALKENQERVEDARKDLAEFNRKANEEAQIAIKEAELKQLQDTKEANKRTYDEKLRNLKSYQEQFLTDLDANNLITNTKTTEHYNLLNSLDKKYADDKKAIFQDMVTQINSILSQISSVSGVGLSGGGGGSGGGSSSGGKVVQVQENGKAPPGLSAGDIVQTGGGDYKITGGKYGSYTSEKVKSKTSSTSTKSSGKKYKSGGLIDYTGMAWVDGSKSSPEVAFNQSDASKLWNLVQNGSPNMNNSTNNINNSNSKGGDIYINNIDLPSVTDAKSLIDGLKRIAITRR